MPYYCTVPRCTSMAGKAKNVSFHQFPRDEELAKLWNKILKRGKPYTKYSKVCSLHFTAEDYTITSVGKNKGQWRTLRKDAIPSQNLPSESPTPYQRKQWGAWSHSNPPANVLDPAIQQQVAQAIYMQTMLAMQAAGAAEIPTLNHSNEVPLPLTTEAFAHTSTTTDTDILKGKQTNTDSKITSYKCMECSKCFKDPDVFILHKRSHIKNEKNEKENFNLNLTLQANPILANLLKTNTENANIFDNNMVSVESLLMTALAANMEGYMRNFTSMIKGDRDVIDHDSTISVTGELDHEQNDLDNDRNNLDHDRDDSDSEESKDHLDHNNLDLNQRDNNQKNLDLKRGYYIKDCQSTSEKNVSNLNPGENMIQISDILSQNRDIPLINRDKNVFQNRIVNKYSNSTYDNDRSVRYYENEKSIRASLQNGHESAYYNQSFMGRDTGKSDHGTSIVNHDTGLMDHDKGQMDHDKGQIDHDTDMMDRDKGMMDHDDVVMGRDTHKSVTNYESQGSNDEQICDSDLNESVDSNNLVIDENI